VHPAALAVPEHAREGEDAALARRQQLFHRKFRRRVQEGWRPHAVRPDDFSRKSMQMRLIARRGLQDGGLHFDEALAFEISPQSADDPRARQQARAAIGMAVLRPEWGGRFQGGQSVLAAPFAHTEQSVWPLAAKSVCCPPQ
jgi:hypothetical protein